MPSRTATALALASFLVAAPGVAQALPAQDDPPVPSSPPGTSTSAPPPVETDANDPDLRLEDGATLADPKVLDIVSVVETQGGEERRSDSNSTITIALQAEVLFPKDSARLTGEARSRIAVIADEIEQNDPDTVRVFGFTDDLGSYEHGVTLSKNRANAVHQELTNTLRSGEITYVVRGYSEDYPIADNSTEAGRKKNRRVEVSFPRGQ